MNQFDIPIVLFLFKRVETTLQIIDRIAEIKPKKIYLLSDAGRNYEEKKLVEQCRLQVEKRINWNCQIIKKYAHTNIGVYENIGEGAKWVFKQEPMAIFLEDDNLPEISFFKYCEELLQKYEKNSEVLWICGTNYLGKYKSDSADSYMFTKHLLPCGWASWSSKFIEHYDGELAKAENEVLMKKVKKNYENKALYHQQIRSIKNELKRKHNNEKFLSWDYQMAFSLRVNNLYGISPKKNLIKNIGVDEHSEHGGTSFDNVMTQRFCGMDSYALEFPLTHPESIRVDHKYEKIIGNIILEPFSIRVRRTVGRITKKFLNIEPDFSFLKFFLKLDKRKKDE